VNAPVLQQIEFSWRDTLAYALDLADRSTVAPDRVERDRLLAEALALYQAARRLKAVSP